MLRINHMIESKIIITIEVSDVNCDLAKLLSIEKEKSFIYYNQKLKISNIIKAYVNGKLIAKKKMKVGGEEKRRKKKGQTHSYIYSSCSIFRFIIFF